jgi:sulfide:quinone oxidoreductase
MANGRAMPTLLRMPRVPAPIVIAGGGVAGLEAALALRELLHDAADLTLVAGSDTFHYRPLGVGEPFGLGHPHRHELAPIARDLDIDLVRDTMTAVDPIGREVVLGDGGTIAYDQLIVAVGAPSRAPGPHGVLFDRARNAAEFDEMLADLQAGLVSRVAFAIPRSVTWPLPAYELALMTAAWGASAGVEVIVVSHESAPLELFGGTVSAAVAAVLERSGVAFIGGTDPVLDSDVLIRLGNHQVQAERIVVLPEVVGPAIPGLPADPHGFVRVDPWGRAEGLSGVFAIGDAAAHPIKHGGLAAQQALAAARALAFDTGAREELMAARPILRGLLRTLEGPLYLRAALDDVEGSSTASPDPLWWPPSKLAAPRLTSYLGRVEQARAEARVVVSGAHLAERR